MTVLQAEATATARRMLRRAVCGNETMMMVGSRHGGSAARRAAKGSTVQMVNVRPLIFHQQGESIVKPAEKLSPCLVDSRKVRQLQLEI